MHDITRAILLGLVEGLTEFIPVSSTGHLILVGNLIEFNGPLADTFDIVIQLGAILAVVVLYRERFTALIPIGKSANQSGFKGRAGLTKLVITCIPMMILGALFQKKIKALLFAPIPVAVSLIVGGVIMILVERRRSQIVTNDLDQLTIAECLKVGLFQCAALWPGMSRSGSMMVGGLLCGLSRTLAAQFSFLVAVPMMCAATANELLKTYHLFSFADIELIVIGFIVSFFSAILAVKAFIALLGRWTLVPFAWYRIVLGLVVIGWQIWIGLPNP